MEAESFDVRINEEVAGRGCDEETSEIATADVKRLSTMRNGFCGMVQAGSLVRLLQTTEGREPEETLFEAD
jgi:hypothetical protein